MESRHRGNIAVVDSSGKLLGRAGDPGYVSYMRSAAKPIQALAVVMSGAYDELGLTARELAVTCASHNGEEDHVTAVSSILSRAGTDETALLCGYHPPMDAGAYRRLMKGGGEPGPLHHNCSGKHAGMLAVCRTRGWDMDGYTHPQHPLQQYLENIMSLWTGVPAGEIITGIDGCGVPVVGVPLSAMALAWARLVRPEVVGQEWIRPARTVVSAMRAHPFMVGGTGRICTAINGFSDVELVSKGGAEGVYCLASLKDGWALAVKIEDGAGRASGLAGLRTSVAMMDLDPDALGCLSSFLRVPVKNTRDEAVGELAPAEPWPDLRPAKGCGR